MKGREICQQFYETVGEPAITEGAPQSLDRLAVGLHGGSQAHGNDDEISRDHAWGPGFDIWLCEEDYRQRGTRLQDILDQLPRKFLDFTWPDTRKRTCVVLELDEYMTSLIGYTHPPDNPIDWLRIPEEYLYEVTPQRIFLDRPGIVTERFMQFSYYPEDVWCKRLITWVSWVAEWGEKHLLRAWKRGEHLTAKIYCAQFATAVMRTAFLLNRRYAPYEKWLHREFLSLPRLSSELNPILCSLMDGIEPYRPVNEVVELITMELRMNGIDPIPTDQVAVYPSILRDFARGIRTLIADESVASMPTYADLSLPPTRDTWTRVISKK